ncbi:TetR family transcriptional regulator [Streptomyces sp. NPDC001581]|uniref:TetR family transcriptional regulator n=1 Tax=Streptomyces sp. NPDC001581 TaxID=3154386 RepID=UPI003328B378
MAALMAAAHVSPRTFHAHFPTKNALVEQYLRRFESENPIAAEAELDCGDLTPARRLLAIASWPSPRRPERPTRRPSAGNSP